MILEKQRTAAFLALVGADLVRDVDREPSAAVEYLAGFGDRADAEMLAIMSARWRIGSLAAEFRQRLVLTEPEALARAVEHYRTMAASLLAEFEEAQQ
jgi:hypothetical protein